MAQLTKRELEVLSLLAHGSSNHMIAERLRISMSTVALHLHSARRRLGARSREHAIAIAVASGMIRVAEMNGSQSI